MVQMTLGLKPATAKKLNLEDIDRLIEALSYGNKWKHLSELIENHNLEMSRRSIQLAANASDGQVISSDKGLALLSRCSPDEIIHSANKLRAQAKQMEKRATEIFRRYHRGPR